MALAMGLWSVQAIPAQGEEQNVQVPITPPGAGSADIDFKDLPRAIDSESGVFGLPLGASLEDTVARFGSPNGLARLGGGRTALFYGTALTMVFEDGALSEVQYQNMGQLKFNLESEEHPFFDHVKWELGPGIQRGMKFKEAAELLGREDAEPDYELTAVADNGVRFKLSFSSTQWSEDRWFKLTGFTMRRGSSDSSAQPFMVPIPAGPDQE
ncbi:hypothetical protein AN478_03815 [Thiohalorhabdus denitrificans]|nr:hypothetical protein AN478_03815 [Thiohalorhabdus denitrificans]